MNKRATIGRSDSTHLIVEVLASDCLEIRLHDAQGIIIGKAWAGSDGAEGYRIHRRESWSDMPDSEQLSSILSLLSAYRFTKLMEWHARLAA